MKKIGVLTILAFIVCVSPSHAFLDYFFSGSDSRDAIDNSTVGDLRAWWTGNPAYQFNPYYSGSNTPAQQKPAAPQTQQDPVVQYVPSQQNYGAPQAYQQPGQPGVPQQGYVPQQPQPQQYAPQQYGAQQYPQQQAPMNYGQQH